MNITLIPRNQLAPNPWNRKHFKPDALAELAASIRAQGIVQPLVVRPLLDEQMPQGTHPVLAYEIIAGERRWRAAELAQLAELPCVVRDLDDRAARELCAIENLQREDLTALEEAQGYSDLLKECQCKVEDLEERLGKKRSHIYSRLRLLTLPESVRQAIGEGHLEATVGDLIATIPGKKQQEEALAEILDGDSVYDHVTNSNTVAPFSFRKAKAFIEENYRKSLKDAPFDLKQKFEGLPTCQECPKRTGNIEGLAAGSSPNVCTDPSGCYAQKVTAHQSKLLDKHRAAGHTVLDASDAKKLWHYGSLNHASGYLDAGAGFYDDTGNRVNYLKALGKKMPTPVYAVNPDGEVEPLYPQSAVLKAAAAAKILPEESKPETAEEKAKRQAREELEEHTRAQEEQRIIEACMKVVEDPKLDERRHALLWAFVVRRLLEISGGNNQHIFRRRNIAPSSDQSYDNLSAKSDLTLRMVRGRAIEQLISDNYAARYDEETLNELAALCGVDPSAIAREVAAAVAQQQPDPRKEVRAKEVKGAKAAKAEGRLPMAKAKATKLTKAKKATKVKTMAKK